jgi:mRNA interferase MazF
VKRPQPERGDVWLLDFDPTRGHEQSGKRPALVLSANLLNKGPAGLVIVLPLTSQFKNIRSHVRVDPPAAGLKVTSYVKCEDVRSVAKERLIRRWGRVPDATMRHVESVVRVLMEL